MRKARWAGLLVGATAVLSLGFWLAFNPEGIPARRDPARVRSRNAELVGGSAPADVPLAPPSSAWALLPAPEPSPSGLEPDRLFIPGGVDHPRALLVFLHGLDAHPEQSVRALGLQVHAERHGYAVWFPLGAKDFSGRAFWNASRSCCNFDGLPVDHVTQLREQLATFKRELRLADVPVYLIGYSNGGFMAHRAACEWPELLTGIVSIAGAAPTPLKSCRPSATGLRVLQIHGSDDPIVHYRGGVLFADRRRPPHPSAEASVAAWARLNRCEAGREQRGSLDLDPRIPGAETTVFEHPNCRAGSVQLWRIEGGDHASGLGHASFDAIWDFVRAGLGP